MKKKQDKRHSAEQIVRKLREADTMLAAGKMSDGVDVVVRQQPSFFKIVNALNSPDGFTRLLHRWQQQSDEDPDRGDHDQNFDESKTGRPSIT